jgi:transposase
VSDSEDRSAEQRSDVLDALRTLLADGRADDVVSLFSKLVTNNTELAVRAARVDELATRNIELEKQLEKLLARVKKSETVSKAQLVLFADAIRRGEAGDILAEGDPRGDANDRLRDRSGLDDEIEPETKPVRERPTGRKPAPEDLPRIQNTLAVLAGERACPRCGKERACIGHDTTEVIDLIPAQVVVRQDRREKLACKDCEAEVVRAPTGDKVVAGGKYGDALVIDMLVGKYADGLPLHRQRERYQRLGLDIPVATLVDQVRWSTDLLRPLWRAALAECIASKVMHLDATGLPVLDRGAPNGKRIGSLWGYVGDDVCAYVYASTGKARAQKSGEMGPEEVLALRDGYTVADASSLFDASFATRPNLIECGCGMHARRYFVKALEAGDTRAALPIGAYKKLYEIEDEIRDRDPDEKLAVRREQSQPVFDELVAWAQVHQPFETPSSKLGDAIRYLLNHRVALGRFLESGLVPIDNGKVERLHIRAALARKNFLFAGNDDFGERAAIAFTILGCCRVVGVNPVEYLASVFPILSRPIRLRDLPDLLPHHWKVRRDAATAFAAALARLAD